MPRWDETTKFRLLMAVINVLNSSPPNWSVVAAKMGKEYTPEAVRQQYQKIKKLADSDMGTTTEDGSVAIPKKRARASNSKPKSTKAAKGGKKANAEEDADDGDEMPSPPKKKAKGSGKSMSPDVDDVDSGVDDLDF